MDREDEFHEYKRTTRELNEGMISISSILNKHRHGTLYFGLKNDGTPYYFEINDSTLRDVSRKIYESIKPQIFPEISTIFVSDTEIIKVEFNGEDIPYSAFGKYYIRVADEDRELTPAELRKIMIGKEYEDNWEDKLSDELITDINTETLQNFYLQATECHRLPEIDFDPENLLSKMNLFRSGHLTNAGSVLFSKNQPITLKMAVFATDRKDTFLDIEREEGNIFQLIDEAVKFLIKNIRWRVASEGDGIHRKEIPEIPIDALREAIINCFAHARYDLSIEHEIDIFSDRISIMNPGSFANEYSPIDFYNQDIHSYLRNEKIARVLYLCKDVETFGSGIRKIYTLCGKENVNISYINSDTDFTVEFSRTNRNIMPNGIINDAKNGTINDKEKIILDEIVKNPHITINELSTKMNISARTINRIISSLKSKNIIERSGSNKTGYWVIH